MVEVAGVIVTIPVPRFSTSKEKPAAKLPVACGSVTATADALLNVTNSHASVVWTV
jgi:hypothetical protein